MAVIHHTTLTPGKLDLLAAWLPRQPWYRAGGGTPELARAGGFRLDDPDGEVGLEFMVVTDAATSTAYHVPATYRDRELPGASGALIGTAEHRVRGHRWVYDGAHDPVLVGQLVALIQGRAEPQAQSVTGTPDPTVTTGSPAAGPLAPSGAAIVASTTAGTEIRVPAGPDGSIVVQINRVLQPGDGPGPGVSATWQQPDGAQARGVFATAHHQPAR
jgi:hypothetical protein